MQEKLIKLKTEESEFLALWRISKEGSLLQKNILLTHGTFSNRKVMEGISAFLVANGFTCWLFEWRGHGSSSIVKEPYNFETIGTKDFQLVFQYLFDICSIDKIDCVCHSGGGICLTMALIDEPKYQESISSISMFASQAFGAASSQFQYIKLLLAKYLSFLMGSIPAKIIGGVENETYFMMKQWFDWNLRKEFKGIHGIDYLIKMKAIKIPILAIYGAGDKFIAPAEGCVAFNDAFENKMNKSIHCSIKNGFAEDYNHSRIIHSRNAEKEVYPLVLNWINDKD